MLRALDFDPLVELHGMWTTDLADRYLPLSYAPLVGKYECRDGHLIMSRRGTSSISFATASLSAELADPARAAGYPAYLTLGVVFDPGSWIEPDLVVLNESAKGQAWIPADKVLIPVEVVSASSHRARIDKLAWCAAAGIPYFMRVEIDEHDVRVELFKLDGDRYVIHAKALAGQRFETELPFPLSFDPGVLSES